MKLSLIFACCIFLSPHNTLARSSHYLGDRISIDGFIGDYTPDEWILDQTTSFPELQGDSRWGRENDIRRIGITWDDDNLYIALDCSNLDTYIAILVDLTCGGVEDLRDFTFFRRNLEFASFSPDLLFIVPPNLGRCRGIAGNCDSRWQALGEDGFQCSARSVGVDGAVELAVAWEDMGNFVKEPQGVVLPEDTLSLGLTAIITGSSGTGSGDAAPNPSSVLQNDSTSFAVLDNHIGIPLDADGDGVLDLGVKPRSVATFSLNIASSAYRIPSLGLVLASKVFAPESGEKLRFRTTFESSCQNVVNLDASVYSSNGRMVKVLYTDLQRSPSASSQWDEWDGRDSHGRIVTGGIYILVVSASLGDTKSQETAKAAFAVFR